MPQKFHLLNFVDNFSWVGSTNSFPPGVCVCVCVCVCITNYFCGTISFGLVWSLVPSLYHCTNQVWSLLVQSVTTIKFGHRYHWYQSGLVTGGTTGTMVWSLVQSRWLVGRFASLGLQSTLARLKRFSFFYYLCKSNI